MLAGRRFVMRKTRALIILFTLTTVILTPLVCDGREPEVSDAGLARELVSGNSAFALDLYNALSKRPGNLFISPYSISAALAITYGGARGNTAAQMADALHFTLDNENLHKHFGLLNENLKELGASGAVELNLANALWAQRDQEFLEGFTELGQKHHDAEVRSLDFINNPGGATDEINAWASDETGGRITDLIEPGILDTLTRLVITNAIYFKGDWSSRFDADKTGQEPFWVAADSSVMVDMMHQTGSFRFTQTNKFKMLELPYEGGDLSMVLLLPNERTGLAGIERFLSLKSLRIWLRQLQETEVAVSLPRFRASSGLLLNDALKRLGMTDAFSARVADFSGMTGGRDLFIYAVVHEGFVEVDEQGTEAAASTAVVMSKRSVSMDPVSFRADHPFIFLIRDRTSGSILFIGRMADPTG
jgi:serpin B